MKKALEDSRHSETCSIQRHIINILSEPCQNSAKCADLFVKLAEVEKCLGGRLKAYAIEKKTRMFVDQVLKYICEQLNSFSKEAQVYIDMEVEMKLFNEIIRPDYQIMRAEGDENAPDTPLYAIEVKRMDHRTNLADCFDQHFKQLRHLCIQNSLKQIFGVHTNYRQWYFTKYSLANEIRYLKYSQCQPNSLHSQSEAPNEVWDLGQRPILNEDGHKYNIFEIS